jgi:hypothetical protein
MADNESDSAFLAYVIGGLYLRRVMMVNKLVKMISVSFRVVLGVLLLFCVSTVEAQTVQKIRRKVLSYSMPWIGEEHADVIDYVEIEWSHETENWWQKVLDEENKGERDGSSIAFYEEKRNDLVNWFDGDEDGWRDLRTLTLTFHYNEKYKGNNKIGYIKLLGGELNGDYSIGWNRTRIGWFAFYDLTNMPWYTMKSSGSAWAARFIAINPSVLKGGDRNGVPWAGWVPVDTEKGKNKLVLADSYVDSLTGDEVGIIIELDGPFF